ncbi:Protein GrpE [bacterium AB1]|nr:Protein GrpE [bacterium AB1]
MSNNDKNKQKDLNLKNDDTECLDDSDSSDQPLQNDQKEETVVNDQNDNLNQECNSNDNANLEDNIDQNKESSEQLQDVELSELDLLKKENSDLQKKYSELEEKYNKQLSISSNLQKIAIQIKDSSKIEIEEAKESTMFKVMKTYNDILNFLYMYIKNKDSLDEKTYSIVDQLYHQVSVSLNKISVKINFPKVGDEFDAKSMHSIDISYTEDESMNSKVKEIHSTGLFYIKGSKEKLLVPSSVSVYKYQTTSKDEEAE